VLNYIHKTILAFSVIAVYEILCGSYTTANLAQVLTVFSFILVMLGIVSTYMIYLEYKRATYSWVASYSSESQELEKYYFKNMYGFTNFIKLSIIGSLWKCIVDELGITEETIKLISNIFGILV
jgi:hypothetical protein